MNKQFDPNKPVRTRDGRAARIIATDLNGYDGDTLVVVITHEDGHEGVYAYRFDGTFLGGVVHGLDLINVPEMYGADNLWWMGRPQGKATRTTYVNLGRGIGLASAAAEQTGDPWPVAKLTIEGDRIVSAEFVTVDEVEA